MSPLWGREDSLEGTKDKKLWEGITLLWAVSPGVLLGGSDVKWDPDRRRQQSAAPAPRSRGSASGFLPSIWKEGMQKLLGLGNITQWFIFINSEMSHYCGCDASNFHPWKGKLEIFLIKKASELCPSFGKTMSFSFLPFFLLFFLSFPPFPSTIFFPPSLLSFLFLPSFLPQTYLLSASHKLRLFWNQQIQHFIAPKTFFFFNI